MPTGRSTRASLGLPEHKIRVVSPDVGGGFGNKVPMYPGYVCAAVAAMTTGRPVKWMEDRSENLMSTGFARDYVMRGGSRPRRDGRILGVRVVDARRPWRVQCDRAADQVPGRLLPRVHRLLRHRGRSLRVTGVYTNKAPGGVAYACSFRIAEAVYLIERLVDCLAAELEARSGAAAAREPDRARAVPL